MSDRDEALQKAARDLFSQARGDPQRLAMLAAQFQQAAQARVGGALTVVGGVSFRTGEPFVQVEWGENAGQLNVDQARSHAQLLLEAAQNAVADAALLAWAKDELNIDAERAAHLIDALRRYRHDRWGQPDLEIELDRPAPEDP